MEATLKASSLKALTKSLLCLSKYGDELTIQATTLGLALSSTSSSKSAYGRFSFPTNFFERYNIGFRRPGSTWDPDPSPQVIPDVKGEVLVKILLSILRSRSVEKTVERVDLEIYDGPESEGSRGGSGDELQSRLVVRLHCKQGIIKTHRLFLNVPTVILGPRMPESEIESRLRIGPDAVKDILEHFPHSGMNAKGKSGKARDVQLVWEFGASKVKVRSMTVGSGANHLATELTIEADEFDEYDVPNPPITMAWHLREFSATITHAGSLNLPLELRFTEPSAPLFIEIDTSDSVDEVYETFFVIATSQIDTSDFGAEPNQPEKQKRARDNHLAEPAERRLSKRKSIKVVSRDASETARPAQAPPPSQRVTRPPPSLPHAPQERESTMPPLAAPPSQPPENPLFIPGSQLSQREQSILKESGWGDGDMSFADFEAFMNNDGDDVLGVDDVEYRNEKKAEADEESTTEDDEDEDMLMSATQVPPGSTFEPLFDD